MKTGVIWFVLYVVFGLYFVNSALGFVQIPESVAGFEQWITLIGGILIILGGINHFKAKSKKKKD